MTPTSGTVQYSELFIIGEKIRCRREELHLSQEQLAELADTTGNTISRIESAKWAIKVDMLYRLASAMEISVDELLPNSWLRPDKREDAWVAGIRKQLSGLCEEKKQIVMVAVAAMVQGLAV